MRLMTKWLPLLAALTVATVAPAISPKMACSLTGKRVNACCCEKQKDGKLFCTLAKKTIEKCCCKGM